MSEQMQGMPNSGGNSFSGQKWTDVRFNDSMIMDAAIKLSLGLVNFGYSEFAEVLEIVGNIRNSNEEDWINAWSARGAIVLERAEKAEEKGKTVSASLLYLRASTYYRMSIMCFSQPEDPRIREHSLIYKKCFAKYLELSDYPGEVIQIPFEDSYLPGYFFRSPVAGEKAPVIVVTPGRDNFVEETVWIFDAAIRRGFHCIVFDGPGQGAALRLNNIHFRPDWESPVGKVIDYAVQIPGVDPERIGSIGMSMGGLLTVRAAAFEKRIKVNVSDPGNLNWGGMITGPMGAFLGKPIDTLPPQLKSMVNDYAWKHDIPKTIEAVLQVLKDYDYSSIAGNITCKMLVVDGTAELIPDAAKNLYDTLKCPKDYLLFDEKTTAQMHCQIGAPVTAAEYIFDWVSDNL